MCYQIHPKGSNPEIMYSLKTDAERALNHTENIASKHHQPHRAPSQRRILLHRDRIGGVRRLMPIPRRENQKRARAF